MFYVILYKHYLDGSQRFLGLLFIPANISCFPRRLQRNTFRLPRRLEDVFKTYLQYVFLKRLQDVFKSLRRRLQDVLSWKTKKCCPEDFLKSSSRRLQYVFTKTNFCWDATPVKRKGNVYQTLIKVLFHC